jgi:hypothetical protein
VDQLSLGLHEVLWEMREGWIARKPQKIGIPTQSQIHERSTIRSGMLRGWRVLSILAEFKPYLGQARFPAFFVWL